MNDIDNLQIQALGELMARKNINIENDIFWLNLCDSISEKSKDPSTKVGSIIIRPDNTVASIGYNGFPRHCRDDKEIYNNRELKYKRVVHAEANAIVFAKEDCNGYTLYVNFPPCSACAGLIINKGISRIVTWNITNERWMESWKLSKELFDEAGLEISFYERT